jgi:DNA-binding NtrC family response regulator
MVTGGTRQSSSPDRGRPDGAIERIERRLVARTVAGAKGNQAEAAKLLGLSLGALRERLPSPKG